MMTELAIMISNELVRNSVLLNFAMEAGNRIA